MTAGGGGVRRMSQSAEALGVPRTAWTPRELADSMGIKDVVTVRNWINEGRIAAIRVGQTYRIPESERLRLENEAKAEAEQKRAS